MLEYLTENADAIVVGLLSLNALASAIVSLTPTPKDDKVLAHLYRTLEVVGGIFGRAKEKSKLDSAK